MSNPFFDHPILNSPYLGPSKHWELDASAEQAWWEELGRANLNSRHFQGGLWCMCMAGRFPHDYGRRRPVRATTESETILAELEANLLKASAPSIRSRVGVAAARGSG